jgi:hypothetical protein
MSGYWVTSRPCLSDVFAEKTEKLENQPCFPGLKKGVTTFFGPDTEVFE